MFDYCAGNTAISPIVGHGSTFATQSNPWIEPIHVQLWFHRPTKSPDLCGPVGRDHQCRGREAPWAGELKNWTKTVHRTQLSKSMCCMLPPWLISDRPNFHVARHVTCRHDTTRSSCRACRAVLLDKLDTAKMHGLDTSNKWVDTLQATRCGQSFPKPSGGEMRRSRATTSRCLMRPLANSTDNINNNTLLTDNA